MRRRPTIATRRRQACSRCSQRLLALFAVGALLFDFPLLALWDRDVFVFGVPLFPAALFIVSALLIVALAWLTEGAEADRDR